METDPHSVNEILDRLVLVARGRDRVAVEDIVAAVGNRSYGPVLLVSALIESTPVGGVPGVPTFLATIITIVTIQMLIGRDHVWLPGFIRHRQFGADKLVTASARLRRLAAFLDKWFHGRLQPLTHGIPVRIAALPVLALCATIPPLEIVPFASSPPMWAIAAFGLALLVRDGFLMLVSTGLGLAALGLGLSLLGGAGTAG